MRQILIRVRIAPANCCACLVLQLPPQLDRVLCFSFQEFFLGACHHAPFCSGDTGFTGKSSATFVPTNLTTRQSLRSPRVGILFREFSSKWHGPARSNQNGTTCP